MENIGSLQAPEAVINVNEELVRKEFARVAGHLTKQPGSMSDSPSMSDANPKTATRLSGITPKSRSPGISTANVPVGSPHHDLIKNGGHATGARSPCRAPRDPSFNINTLLVIIRFSCIFVIMLLKIMNFIYDSC